MARSPAAGLVAASVLGLLLSSGCQPGAESQTSATGSPEYGENKMPPSDQLKPVPGKGARSPGAPPQKR